MPFNGSGVFTANSADLPVSGQVISSTKANNLISDYSSGLSLCITKDGQQTFTANQNMGGFALTNIAVGAAATPGLRWAAGDGLFSTGAGNVSIAAASTAVVSVSATALSALALVPTGATVPTNGLFLPAANSPAIAANTVERMRFTGVELGLPGSGAVRGWGANFRSLEYGNRGSGIWGRTDSTQLGLVENAYFDGTNFKYVATAPAAVMTMVGGAVSISVAPSGTAGNTATMSTALTVNATSGLLSALLGLSLTGDLTMATTASRLIPGATSFAVRNNANSGDNLLVADAGAVTVSRGVFTTRGFADNATAAAWNIDSGGRLKNNGAAQPWVGAGNSAARATVGTFITYTSVSDQSSAFVAATGIFTAAVAGKYLVTFTFSGAVASGTGTANCRLANGGGTISGTAVFGLTTNTTQSSITQIISLAAADQLWAELGSVSGTTPSLQVQTMAIVLLG